MHIGCAVLLLLALPCGKDLSFLHFMAGVGHGWFGGALLQGVEMMEKFTNTVVIVLRNSVMDDAELLTDVVARDLREYLAMIDSGSAANEPQEKFVSTSGTEVSVAAVSSLLVHIPRATIL
jgi:hypothetical protein